VAKHDAPAHESLSGNVDMESRYTDAGGGSPHPARRPPVQWISTDFLELRSHIETGGYEKVGILSDDQEGTDDTCVTQEMHTANHEA
jgi:hypothetical protein